MESKILEAEQALEAAQAKVSDPAIASDYQALIDANAALTAAQAEEQVSAIPADFLRFVPETFWNRTNRWRLSGPVTPAEWKEVCRMGGLDPKSIGA